MPKYNVDVDSIGTQFWYINGKLHREDGPAIIYPNGGEDWYINGKLHREDGPAAIFPDGIQKWYINDQLHREDGPAAIFPDGKQFWYINGKQLTEQQFNDRKQSMDGKEITIDGITYILKKK